MEKRCGCGELIVERGFDECEACEEYRVQQGGTDPETDDVDYAGGSGGGEGGRILRVALDHLHKAYLAAIRAPELSTTTLEALVAAEEIVQNRLAEVGAVPADAAG